MRKLMLLKIIIPMIIIGIVITACKKDEPSDPANNTFDLEFVIEQTDFGGLKSTNDDVPSCADELVFPMDYVVFEFGGNEYTSPVFIVDGQMLTQAVKLPIPVSGNYNLTKFLVYHDVTSNGPSGDDLLLRAAPEPGSTYHNLMVNKLDLTVAVEAFKKKQVVIDVLCFEDLFYQEFGFTWFELNKVKIERQCFFGDVCTDDLTIFDVAGSMYKLQTNGIQMDMPAIMQIKTYKMVDGDWGQPMNIFDNILHENNDPWYGEGACMEVFWANDEDLEEDFKFELYVHLPTDNGMEWVFIDEYIFKDDNCPDPGQDGVVDFVLGNCQYDEADFIYTWPPAAPDFATFFIRNNDGSIESPWDTDIVVAENTDEDGYSAETPRGGQKVGYGTNFFDGFQINTFETVNWDKVSGKAGVVSYLNFWVTDGTNFAIISSENDYRGSDFGTRQEWKVFEFDAGVGLDWLFDSGTGAKDAQQYLTKDGVRVTMSDFADNIVLTDPGSPYPAYVGTGAPRGGYGIQLIFGDTQSNFVGDYHLENLSLTVGGVVYSIGN